MRHELRSVPRFFVDPPLAATAGTLAVRLVDFSTRGARIQLAEPLRPGLRVELSFSAIAVQATVLWCQPDELAQRFERDRFLAGVVFDAAPPAVDELIDDLCVRGAAVRVDDCRHLERYRLQSPLAATFGGRAVSIRDLSFDGARLVLPYAVEREVLAPLRFDAADAPLEVVAKVVWCRPAGPTNRFDVGVWIDGAREPLRAAIHQLCLRGDARVDRDSLRRKYDARRAMQEL